MRKNTIRVMVVEDSPVLAKVLIDMLTCDPNIIIAGIAHTGKEAVELVPKLKPDIITMDIHMPVMDGLEATKQIMAYHPTPILIVSTSVFDVGMEKVFKAISYGALDVLERNEMQVVGCTKFTENLIAKIKFLSEIKVIRHPLAKLEKGAKPAKHLDLPIKKENDRIVGIVSSTGGPQALLAILRNIPPDFPCGIVIVQHIATGFVDGLADWLNDECQIKVKVGRENEKILPGVVYIAPCDVQMIVGKDKAIHISQATDNLHNPSGDVLLESVAGVYKSGAIGVILTGMGKDGAYGIKAIKEVSGWTIAQDEKTCIVFGMPKAAIELGVVNKISPLENIAGEIIKFLEESEGKHAG